ncbi:MAG: alpha/beta hydrolase [Bacteroidales bacterium]|nr:alpha/beta hydrolase [Bacteroidales bacterium]
MPTFATAADLSAALQRFDAETVPGSCETARYRLRYRTWGPVDGPPLVLIHGLCDLSRSFCMLMSRCVDAGLRCIAYELADGRHDGAQLNRYRHEHFVEDLIALLDHLQLPQVNLLGSSFGSTVTLRALATYPERFLRAALQGGFARRPLILVERGLAHLGRTWPWLMGDLPIRYLVMSQLERTQFTGCPRELFRFLIANSGLTPIRAAAHRGLILDKLDLRPYLPQIPHPLLMIGGDRDAIVPRQYEAEVEAGVQHVRRIEYSPCGHYPQYTLPGPMAAELIAFYQS